MSEPRTEAGRALDALEGWDWAGLSNEETRRIIQIEHEAAASARADAERLAAVVQAAGQLRVSSGGIRTALSQLPRPGYWDEGIAMVAAQVMADVLDALAAHDAGDVA